MPASIDNHRTTGVAVGEVTVDRCGEATDKHPSSPTKILLVIHGYPRRYNAGSEVYTQTLAHALRDAGCEVAVFAREEDAFLPDYHLRVERDPLRDDIAVYLVNHARANARFHNHYIDTVFAGVVDAYRPDVVHFGHLSHLSVGLPAVAKSRRLATVFTLHDFWLMCPRGQFLQWGLSGGEPWALCDGQDNHKCASRCYNRLIAGLAPHDEVAHWEAWVGQRMDAVRRACGYVDLFIAPSRHLLRRHVDEFGLAAEKVVFIDYGFPRARYRQRARRREPNFVFGYIGRHHPSKGLHLLIDAFSALPGDAGLRIWGRTEGQLSESLRRRAQQNPATAARIQWLSEYRNEDIVRQVFERCDCIVVPSIWDENSPLVIHEAQQCGVPVITAAHGGMGEYVRGGVNGLTFAHRDAAALRTAMQAAIDDPDALTRLGKRGYLHAADGQIPGAAQHADDLVACYRRLLCGGETVSA